jgi:hypothetical protein
VEIGGQTYLVEQIQNHRTADLRVAKLEDANLTSFVPLYINTDEVSKAIVAGGYGKGRGNALDDYGYTWAGSSNQIQRWGQNIIDDAIVEEGNYLLADFDGLGSPGAQPYEAALAEWDSGGGWFIYDNNQWKVAGLSHHVSHRGESWYDPPDDIAAVRISSHDKWISGTIAERLAGDLTGDDWVDFADFAVFAQYWQHTNCHSPDWCAGADHEPDGNVDWADLNVIVEGWLGN